MTLVGVEGFHPRKSWICEPGTSPRDPSTFSEGTWTLQTHPKHLLKLLGSLGQEKNNEKRTSSAEIDSPRHRGNLKPTPSSASLFRSFGDFSPITAPVTRDPSSEKGICEHRAGPRRSHLTDANRRLRIS